MILDYYARQKAARALCQQAGLTIIFEKENKPRTDGSRIYVQQPSPDWDEGRMVAWEYSLYHEIAHNDPKMRDVFAYAKDNKVDMSSFLGHVWNVLDDHRIEYHRHDEYAGRAAVMSKGRGLFIRNQFKEDKDFLIPEDKYSQAAAAIAAWDNRLRNDFQRDTIGTNHLFDKLLSSSNEAKDMFDKLMVSGDRFVSRNTTAEQEYQRVKDLLDYLGFDSEEEEGKAKGKDEEGEEGEGKEGEDGEGEGDSSEGWAKFVYHSHSESMDKAKEQPAYSFFVEDKGEEYLPGIVHVHDWQRSYDGKISPYAKEEILSLHGGEGLASTVRKLLQVLSISHYHHGQKKGKIGKNLHRTCIPNAGEYGSKVFKKKVSNLSLDVSVGLLIDMSGSMRRDDKYIHAAKAVLLLNDAIGKLSIPMKIVGFTEKDDGPHHYVYKEYMNKVGNEHMLDALASGYVELEENADGESLLWMYNDIRRRDSARKIIIVLSDGDPAGHRSGIRDFTTRVSKAIQKKGDVELYGIGIMSTSVRQFYKNNVVIKDASELEAALINVIKNKIIGE